MNTSIDRRQLLLATLALSVGGSASAQTPLNPELALKLLIVGRRRPGTTLAEHRHHIRQVHGGLVLQNIAADPNAAPRRYVQNPVFDGTFRTGAPATDPFTLNCDFVTQIWVPDMATLARARQSPFYVARVKDDEDNFVDQATVVFMPTRERVIAGAVPAANLRVKLFGFLQRAPGASPEDFRRVWGTTAWPVGRVNGPLRHVQNDPLPTPMGQPAVDGVDEFWFDDEASAGSFLTRWQAWVAESLVRPGLVAAGSPFVLLAHEDVIYPGPR